jgi:hypothetical protein
MMEEGTIASQLSHEKWVSSVTFFVDVTVHLNEFNIKLQQKLKLLCDTLCDMKVLEVKLGILNKISGTQS